MLKNETFNRIDNIKTDKLNKTASNTEQLLNEIDNEVNDKPTEKSEEEKIEIGYERD